MSSLGDPRGYDDSFNRFSHQSLKPSGLRVRAATPSRQPHSEQPTSVESHEHKQTPAAARSPDSTPGTSDGDTRKRPWINSASKHLRFTKLREKASSSRVCTEPPLNPGSFGTSHPGKLMVSHARKILPFGVLLIFHS